MISRRIVLFLIVQLLLSCGTSRKKIVFSSFSDGFACSWSMTMYSDGSFEHDLCYNKAAGTYEYSNDSVFLSYYKPDKDVVTFVIQGEKIFQADSTSKSLNWMFIQQNDLK